MILSLETGQEWSTRLLGLLAGEMDFGLFIGCMLELFHLPKLEGFRELSLFSSTVFDYALCPNQLESLVWLEPFQVLFFFFLFKMKSVY